MQRRASWCALLAVLVVAGGCAGGANDPNAAPARVHTAGLAASTAPAPVSAPASAIAPPAAGAPAPTTTTTAPVHAVASIAAPAAPAAATTPPPPPPPSLVSVHPQTNGALMRTDSHECSNIAAATITRGVVVVTRTGSAASAITVTYRVAGVVGDYTPLSGHVVIPAGATSAAINVDPSAVDPPAPSHIHRSSTVTVTLDDGAAYDLAAPASAAINLRFDLDQFGCPAAP